MKKLLLNLVALAILSLLAFDLNAQIRTPAPSPTAELKQAVGLTDVTINYSRPGVKDRVIFAEDGLVPFGKIWRTGANSATKFTFSDDVKLGGKEVKAGSYAVLTIPNAEEWTINLYKYESGNFGSYTEKDPDVSLTAKPEVLPIKLESFTIDIGYLRNNSANIALIWDNTLVPIPLEVDVDSKVMAAIESVMGGPSLNDYYEAATYYHNSGKDLKQALKWVQKATSGDNPRYWQVREEALILADLESYGEAISAAKRSLELAQKAENDDYVRMNEKSIKEWAMKTGNN